MIHENISKWCLAVALCMGNYVGAQVKHGTVSAILSTVVHSGVPEEETGAYYLYPIGLRNLGTIAREDNVVCNYLSFNKKINAGALLWAPVGEKINYIYRSDDNPALYRWEVPGYPEIIDTRDAEVSYAASGIYDFPTLQVTADSGISSYKAPGKIKVGGRAEITTADMCKWGETYKTGYYALNGGKNGYLGGTNNTGLTGYGNLFMTAQKNAHLTGVNVYFAFKPTKYQADARLLLRVWYPLETEGQMKLNGLPLEGAYIKISDIREIEEDELPIAKAAVAEFRFQESLQLFDKPLFFVTVEGFGEDPATEDCCMLTEILGKKIDESQIMNLLAHNSFIRFGESKEYNMPVNQFGAQPGASFMICPLIDNLEGPGSIGRPETYPAPCICFSEAGLTIHAVQPVQIEVYNACGCLIVREKLPEGTTTLTTSTWNNGIYIIRISDRCGIVKSRKILIY